VAKDKIIHLDTAAATTAETILGHGSGTGSGSQGGSAPGSDLFGQPGTGPGSAGGPSGSAGDTTVLSNPANLPQRIGRYEIKRLIGAGGMGAVYEAIQDQPRRTVALKVMRSAVASPAALRRFEYESQLLAKLRHPAIAQVYDAGTHQDALTMQSVPYFAMEYVPGARSLTSYAEDQKLSLRQRLLLFTTVCDAVLHGHQRGVIHRDLKPANILVDQQGGVKIIDFGVARSAEGEGGAGGAVMTQHTSVGQLVGTLQYMAPEQCGADTTDIDSRADVYALGVTLYELLTGKLPYELSGRSLVEAVRIVREAPPVAPSSRAPELKGDVETIILKSLEKDPDRRYDSASALAADVQRFLDNEPILARRISMWGKSVRWVKRNRAVATVGGTGVLVLSVTSVVLVSKILVESHRATQNLAVANENLSLITGVFRSMRPDDLKSGSVDVATVFDRAAERLNTNPPAHAETEASFRELLAEGYRNAGKFTQAIEQQKRVVAIRDSLGPRSDAEMAKTLHELGAALYFNGQVSEAEEVYTRALEMRKSLYGPKHADVAMSMTHLAAVRLRQGRLADAESLYKEVLEMRREILPAGSPELAQSVNNLAKAVLLRGDAQAAEGLFRQALSMITASKGDNDLETAFARHNLAGCLLENNNPAEAASDYTRALNIRSSKYSATHPLVSASRLGLARATFLGAVNTARLLADTPTRKPEADAAIAEAKTALNDAKAALATMENTMPADHPDVASASIVLGRMHLDLNEPEAAEPYLRRAQSIYKDPARAAMWELSESRLYLGKCLAMLRRDEEAESMLRQSVEALASSQAPTRLRAQARDELAAFYDARVRPADAAKVRSGELFPTR
jgi:serine/threonine protein kinase/lipopolysaccharide biosynthesis regulator YciM